MENTTMSTYNVPITQVVQKPVQHCMEYRVLIWLVKYIIITILAAICYFIALQVNKIGTEILCMFMNCGKTFRHCRMRALSVNEVCRTSHRRTQQTPVAPVKRTMVSHSPLPLVNLTPLDMEHIIPWWNIIIRYIYALTWSRMSLLLHVYKSYEYENIYNIYNVMERSNMPLF
jgi:hypothetical protein